MSASVPTSAQAVAVTVDSSTSADVGFNGGRDDIDAMLAYVPGRSPFLRVELDWWAVQGGPTGGLDWTRVDPTVQAAVDKGMRVLLVLDYAPPWSNGNHDVNGPENTSSPRQDWHGFVTTWMPTSNQDWTSIVDATVRHFNEPRFRGRVQSYEVWNEPNLWAYAKFGTNTPQEVMVRYWQLTRLASQAVHAVCPACVVVAGPSAISADPARSPGVWLDWAYTNGYGNDFDAVAFHPYPGDKAPDRAECAQPWLNGFGPPGESPGCGELARVHAAMVAHGDTTKKIWATEWGYAYPHPTLPSLEDARDWMVRSVRMWRSLSYAGPLFLYEYRDKCTNVGDGQCIFGVVRADGTRKEPVYTALSDAFRYLRAECLRGIAPPSSAAQPALGTGDCLKREWSRQLASPDGRFRLVLQTDGNLVLYANGVALWATGTSDGVRLDNQLDGNLVLYRANGTVAWASNTAGHGPSTLRVGDDGRLALARNRDNAYTWSTAVWEPADGTTIRNEQSWVAVVAGGAPIWFASQQELQACGYANVTPRYLPAQERGALLAVPRTGTLVRNEGGGVAIIAGGAKVYFASIEELHAAGHTTSTKVPGRWIETLPGTPADGTVLLDNQSGGVWVVAGGARMWFPTAQEIVTAGYGTAPRASVPRRWIETLPDGRPADGTLVRSGTSPQVWRIAAGKRTAVTAGPGATVTTIGESALNAIAIA